MCSARADGSHVLFKFRLGQPPAFSAHPTPSNTHLKYTVVTPIWLVQNWLFPAGCNDLGRGRHSHSLENKCLGFSCLRSVPVGASTARGNFTSTHCYNFSNQEGTKGEKGVEWLSLSWPASLREVPAGEQARPHGETSSSLQFSCPEVTGSHGSDAFGLQIMVREVVAH